MAQYSDPEIGKILSIEGNSRCVDCGTTDPQWVSMNNSVFVCLDCAGIHRNLGVEISYIRSLSMDNWDDYQLKQLYIGGNNRFVSNLEDYKLSANNSHISLNADKIKKKYLYTASQYYRDLLKSELQMTDKPNPPDLKTGQSLIQIVKNNFESTSSINNSSQNSTVEKTQKGFLGKVGTLFNSAASKAKEGYKFTTEKLEKLEIKDKLKETGSKTVGALKSAGGYVSDKATQIAVRFIINKRIQR